MAKKKRSIEDLDAELAAVEAELAALEGRAPPPPRAPAAPARQEPAPAKQEPAPEPAKEASKGRFALPFGKKKGEAADAAPAEAEAPEPSGKSRFAIGKPKLAMPFGKKKREDEPTAEALVETASDEPPAIVRAPAVAVVPQDEEPPAREREVVPVTDGSNWRAEDGAWVRANPETPTPVVRRILDEEGAVVREEPGTQDDLDEVTGVKAEKGVGKIFGGAKSLKMPNLPGRLGRFGRKSE